MSRRTLRSTTRPRSAGHCTSPTRSHATTPGPTLPSGEANGRCAARASGHSSVETPGRSSDEQAHTFPNESAGRVWRSAGRSDHWGHGYATEAGRAAVDWCFANHDVDELVSVILPENTASQAVARRLGFVLSEERTLPHFPQQPHGIWRLARPETGDDPSAFGQ
ncbi:MAG: GNAT family N-acetyltransferase [Acidimicrobiales bacterium]